MKKLLIMAVLFLISSTTLSQTSTTGARISENYYPTDCTRYLTNYSQDQTRISTKNLRDSQCSLLINEVENYLKDVNAPEGVSAEHIVEECLKARFDIVFLLAQGTIETHMGRTGIGRTKKSIFGVVTRRYKTHNKAITDYIELVSTSYLGDDKTFDDLLLNYKSTSGYRYAGERNYEKSLHAMYGKIKRNYDIDSLQATVEDFSIYK